MHDPLLARHSEVSQEHLHRLVELTCRWMFRLRAILGSAFRRQDDRSHCMVSLTQGSFAHTRLVRDVWSPYIDCTQEPKTWYRLVPTTVRTMLELLWLWNLGSCLVDGTLCFMMSGIRTEDNPTHTWFEMWGAIEAFISW